MKGRKLLSSSCGVWNTWNWVWIVGIRNTVKQDNMMGLCLFFSSMVDSKSAYITTGAGISNRWFVNRRWVCCDSNSYWSHPSIWSRCTCTSWFWTTVYELEKSQNLHFLFLERFLFFTSFWRWMCCLNPVKSLMYMKCLGKGFVSLEWFKMQRDRRLVDLWPE